MQNNQNGTNAKTEQSKSGNKRLSVMERIQLKKAGKPSLLEKTKQDMELMAVEAAKIREDF